MIEDIGRIADVELDFALNDIKKAKTLEEIKLYKERAVSALDTICRVKTMEIKEKTKKDSP